MKRYLLVLIIVFLGTATTLVAQENEEGSGACPALVEEALTIVAESCNNLGRNMVCYGNGNVEALNVEEVSLADFASPGDQQNIADIYTLTTEAMDIEQDIWGIVVLALQANIPDTLPGQNVTFLLYGDTQITADPDAQIAASYEAPFQAFRFTSGVGDPQCAEAPRDGLLVQSPEGVTVNFMVNGIEVALGSTALIQGDENATSFTNIEGNVTITADGVSQVLAVGETTSVETLSGVPQAPQPATSMDTQALLSAPVSIMPQQVALPTPQTVELPWQVCSGEFNFPVGQVITFSMAWSFGDEEAMASHTSSVSINGTSVPLWSVSSYDEFGRIYRHVMGPLEAGTYAVTLTTEIAATDFSQTSECTLIIG